MADFREVVKWLIEQAEIGGIADQAEADDQFRADLIANPARAIEARFHMPVRPDVTIRVVEEQPNEFVIVLPPRGGRPWPFGPIEPVGPVVGCL